MCSAASTSGAKGRGVHRLFLVHGCRSFIAVTSWLNSVGCCFLEGPFPWIRGTRVSRNRRPPQHLADLLYLADALHGAVEEWVVRGSLIPMGD
jgi:hypothetical protein